MSGSPREDDGPVPPSSHRGSVAGAIGANAVVLAIFGFALGLDAIAPDQYAAAVQEDEPVEWASFWAFALAAAGFALAARARRGLPLSP